MVKRFSAQKALEMIFFIVYQWCGEQDKLQPALRP